MAELLDALLLLSVIASTPGGQFEPHWLALQLVSRLAVWHGGCPDAMVDERIE
jgi:hypothetical protein